MSKEVPDRLTKLNDPHRLLYVVNAAWFFISHRLPLAEAAKQMGYEVHIAAGTATAEEIQLLESAGFRFHQLGLRRASGNPVHNIVLLLQLLRIYRLVRPRIVHHVTIKPVILGTLIARVLRIHAVVNAVSGLGYSFSKTDARRRSLRYFVGLAYRICLRHPRMTVIFQNPDDRLDFTAWTGLKSINNILIAGSGVDTDRFHPTPEPSGLVRVVLPARMLRDKGVVEFAVAVGRLRASGILFDALLSGGLDPENPESLTEPELRALENQYGVRWIGNCSDVAALFSQTHIVCLPSYREGLPKVLMEASAAGRAIVTTDVPGCRHVVTDGVTGILVPPRQFEPLAASIGRLIADADMRRRLGTAARLRAEREYGVDRIVAKTLDLYSAIA